MCLRQKLFCKKKYNVSPCVRFSVLHMVLKVFYFFFNCSAVTFLVGLCKNLGIKPYHFCLHIKYGPDCNLLTCIIFSFLDSKIREEPKKCHKLFELPLSIWWFSKLPWLPQRYNNCFKIGRHWSLYLKVKAESLIHKQY